MIEGTEAASAARRREREWWLRALALFGSPRTAFSGLRDDSRDAAEARQEPVLALALLGGIEGVLATPAVGDLLDGRERDALVVAVLVFLAGMLYGVASYWIGGGALHLGVRAAGGTGSYRQARHVLAFAAAPLALALLVLWPVRLLLYGGDLFRTGGADESGAAPVALDVVEAGFFLWATGLLVYGVSTVNRWPVLRSLVALALAGLGLVAVATVFALL